MKRHLLSLALLLLSAASTSAQQKPQLDLTDILPKKDQKPPQGPKHPLTLEDVWQVQRLGKSALSPDGKWVAVEVTTYSMEENNSTSEIWLLSTDGNTPRKLTNAKGKNSAPVWSPDSKTVAFVSKRDEEIAQIYLIAPDGGE